LVKPEEVHAAVEIFSSLGYEYDHKRLPTNENIINGSNQFTLYHPQKQQIVEIHWRIFIDPIINYDKIKELVKENTCTISFAGREFNQLTIEFELLYLIIHGGLHTWRRLKWLVDIYEIVNRCDIDKEKFNHLVILLNAQRLIGLCNKMLQHFYLETKLLPVDFPVPEWFFNYALRQVLRESETPNFKLKNILKLRWYYIQAFPDWKYKKKRFLIHFSTMKKLDLNNFHLF
jgi:hypothetical protein